MLAPAAAAARWPFILSVVTSPPNLWHFNYVSYPLAVPGPACEFTLSSSRGARGQLLRSWTPSFQPLPWKLTGLPLPTASVSPGRVLGGDLTPRHSARGVSLVLCMTHSVFTPFNGGRGLRGGVTGLLPCFMAGSASIDLCAAELSLGRGAGIAQA